MASVAVVSQTQSLISFQRMPPKTVPKAAPISSCRFNLLADPLCVPPVDFVPLNKCGQSSTVAHAFLAASEVVWNVMCCSSECDVLDASNSSIR